MRKKVLGVQKVLGVHDSVSHMIEIQKGEKYRDCKIGAIF